MEWRRLHGLSGSYREPLLLYANIGWAVLFITAPHGEKCSAGPPTQTWFFSPGVGGNEMPAKILTIEGHMA